MIEVAREAHTKIGILKGVIPSARIRITVTMRFKPPKIDDQPATQTPR